MSAGFCSSADEVTVVLGAAHEDEHGAARKLALRAAAAVLAAPLGALRLDHEPSGRPVLRGTDADLHLSLSHGRQVVAVAVTGLAPLGVDLELVRPLPAAALAARYFSPEEAAWVGGQGSDAECEDNECERAFLELWTLKEAIGKARGLGLRGGGLRRQVLPRPGWRGTDDARMTSLSPGGTLTVASPGLPAGLVLAVAADGRATDGARVSVHVENCLESGCPAAGGDPQKTAHWPALRLLAASHAADSDSAAPRSTAGLRTSFPLVVRGKAARTWTTRGRL